MNAQAVISVIEGEVASRPFVAEPFFRSMEAGRLTKEDISRFAVQFRHFEEILTMFLEETARCATTPGAKAVIEDNLRDETGEGHECSHVELLDRFLQAMDAQGAPISPAMQNLKDVCATFVFGKRSAIEGVAVLLAYEMQSPRVSSLVASSLRRQLSLDDRAMAFWDVHATLDEQHGEALARAVAEMATSAEDVERVVAAVRDISAAWTEFFAEQHALAAAA